MKTLLNRVSWRQINAFERKSWGSRARHYIDKASGSIKVFRTAVRYDHTQTRGKREQIFQLALLHLLLYLLTFYIGQIIWPFQTYDFLASNVVKCLIQDVLSHTLLHHSEDFPLAHSCHFLKREPVHIILW